MDSGAVQDSRQAYTARLAQAKAAMVRLDRQSAWLANLRVVAFLALAAPFVRQAFAPVAPWMWAAAALGLVAFVALAWKHSRVIEGEARARLLSALNERGLLRLDGKWTAFAETGEEELPPQHLYAGDLNVLGPGSLFQRLDETGTVFGSRQLARWLLEPPQSLDESRARQVAVQELSRLIELRQQVVAEARLAGEARADPTRFLEWVEGPSTLDPIRWAFPVAHVLPLVTLGLFLGADQGWLPRGSGWAGILLQAMIVSLTNKRLRTLYEAVSIGEGGLVRFEHAFRALAEAKLEAPLLRSLQAGLQPGGETVPERLTGFSRRFGFAQLRQSGLMHPIINIGLLWDVHVLFRLDAWRKTSGAGARAWFEALGQVEALSSFATLAFEAPEWTTPELVEGDVALEALDVAHPLLGEAVGNDVAFGGPGEAWLITGSNMAGKTTLLRTVGLSTVMALCGLPVRAKKFRVSRLAVVSSMRVTDSLQRGVSYFYAEVQRIAAILSAAKAAPRRCLFLLDELFMGTNTRERQIASRQLVAMLLDSGASGAVTTHDLALCELANERPKTVKNVHFRDQVVEGALTFDYRVHEGVVQTSNALEVLRRAGIPVVDLPK